MEKRLTIAEAVTEALGHFLEKGSWEGTHEDAVMFASYTLTRAALLCKAAGRKTLTDKEFCGDIPNREINRALAAHKEQILRAANTLVDALLPELKLEVADRKRTNPPSTFTADDILRARALGVRLDLEGICEF